jgi:hypothetical protein
MSISFRGMGVSLAMARSVPKYLEGALPTTSSIAISWQYSENLNFLPIVPAVAALVINATPASINAAFGLDSECRPPYGRRWRYRADAARSYRMS